MIIKAILNKEETVITYKDKKGNFTHYTKVNDDNIKIFKKSNIAFLKAKFLKNGKVKIEGVVWDRNW